MYVSYMYIASYLRQHGGHQHEYFIYFIKFEYMYIACKLYISRGTLKELIF